MTEVERRYLVALADVHPGLVVNSERALRRGRYTCFDLAAGKPRATVVDNARQRFEGGHAQVDAAMAERIVAIVEESGLLDLYRPEGGPEPGEELGPITGLLKGSR